MGLEHGKGLILLKKIVILVELSFGEKSGFGNHTRVEGKHDGETGAGASLFWRCRRKSECPITKTCFLSLKLQASVDKALDIILKMLEQFF